MSGYFPIDRGIFSSSIWLTGTPEEIKLWLWLIGNKDDQGVVPFREIAIADGAKLPRDVVDAALQKFSEPDADSRTRDNDGRKIDRTEEGFVRILNHELYYSKDYSTPRWRKWDERRKAEGKPRKKVPTVPTRWRVGGPLENVGPTKDTIHTIVVPPSSSKASSGSASPSPGDRHDHHDVHHDGGSLTPEAVAGILGGRPSASGWTSRCPSHDDAVESLSIGTGDGGRLLLRCHAGGCSFQDILATIKAKTGMVAPLRRAKPGALRAQTDGRRTVYAIKNVDGEVVAEHVRIDMPDGTKRMSWRRNGANNLGGLPVVDLPLFGSELLAANPGKPVLVVEGEKCADAGRRLGVPLTLATVTGAATIPSDAVLGILSGRAAYLFPDNDAPGKEHMERISAAMGRLGIKNRIVTWDGAPHGGDVADLEAQGGTMEDLQRIVTGAAVLTSPSAASMGSTVVCASSSWGPAWRDLGPVVSTTSDYAAIRDCIDIFSGSVVGAKAYRDPESARRS